MASKLVTGNPRRFNLSENRPHPPCRPRNRIEEDNEDEHDLTPIPAPSNSSASTHIPPPVDPPHRVASFPRATLPTCRFPSPDACTSRDLPRVNPTSPGYDPMSYRTVPSADCAMGHENECAIPQPRRFPLRPPARAVRRPAPRQDRDI